MKTFMKAMSVLCVVALLVIAATMAFATATVTVSTNDSRDHATGTITADGAAVNVSVGFTPTSVVVTKVTNTLAQAYWVSTMAAASCWKILDTSTAANIVTLPTTSCISTYAGSTSAGKGFTLGADTDINVSGDTLRFEATR